MRRHNIKSKVKSNVTSKLIDYLCRGLSACISGGITALLLIPYVHKHRGYFAIGGEWLAVIVVMYAATEFSKWFFHKIC